MKRAYTLSEVLITLGVIGVVSAITLPLIHSKIQWMVLKNQYKKVYSTHSQLLQKIQYNNGTYPYLCYYSDDGKSNTSECSLLFSEMRKNLKAIKHCENNALSGGCVPKYHNYAPLSCGGFDENAFNIYNKATILSDGSILINYRYGMPLYAVDINGLKGPNKGGYDLFVFLIGYKNNGLYLKIDQSCGLSAPGGKSGKEML